MLIRSLLLSFALDLVPRMLEMAFQSFQISKFSGGSMPPDPPRLRGLAASFLYSRLFFPNQLPTSNFIETPAYIFAVLVGFVLYFQVVESYIPIFLDP